MTLTDNSDEDLMVLYQNGNEEAFIVLYERHAKKIFGFIRSKIRNAEQSNDIFQEVFTKIHKSKHLYNRSYPVLPWIFTITRSTLIDFVRKEKKSELEGKSEIETTASEEIDHKVDISPYLSKLPPVQKAAVEMRFFEEKTFEEIAVLLKTSNSNVRQLISRGIKKIKVILGESRE